MYQRPQNHGSRRTIFDLWQMSYAVHSSLRSLTLRFAINFRPSYRSHIFAPLIHLKESFKELMRFKMDNILRIAKWVPVEHPQFAGENN